MQKLFRKAFGIYSGDGRLALRFARLAIFWAFGSATFDTLSDGLFLEKVGASSLPQVYLIIALSMICISTLVLYSLNKTSPYRVLTFAMGCGVLIILATAFMVGSNPSDVFYYAIKILSKMFLQ